MFIIVLRNPQIKAFRHPLSLLKGASLMDSDYYLPARGPGSESSGLEITTYYYLLPGRNPSTEKVMCGLASSNW